MEHSLPSGQKGIPSKKLCGSSSIQTNKDLARSCISAPNGETSQATVFTRSSATAMKYASGHLRQNNPYSSLSLRETEHRDRGPQGYARASERRDTHTRSEWQRESSVSQDSVKQRLRPG